ncbi:protein CHUP1, chloroplastic-like [Chenopodium quinoa]|uniref:protein CHUP1, chloroplastic-like n=1 Tax=Chenopodium quinoa TaxID=63459 RepID=UPI000B79742C|nr:protein CHUP1, chloroplastic-like [Chenopodium quinoa]
MSSSDSRAKMISPLIVKAGIPAALSIAAYVCARIMSKQSSNLIPSPSDEETYRYDSLNPTYDDQYNEDDSSLHGQGVNSSSNLEDKLLELGIHIENLQRRERDLMRQFVRYRGMKEKEFMLMEMKSKMMLEKARAEFLLKEMSFVQEESQRIGSFILEYIKIVQQLEESKKENGLLEMKARKLCKRARQRLKIIRELKMRIQAREEEVLNNQEEIQKKDDLIQELEDEINQMKEVVDHLQREKIEVSNNQLEIDENLCSSNPKNVEIEGVPKEEHERVLQEIEQLQKDREAEVSELTYLKWTNACLRNELLRCHELNKGENGNQAEEIESLEDHHSEIDENYGCNNKALSVHNDHELCLSTNNGHPSRRRRFIRKVKKWVEGGKMDEKEKDEVKCFVNKLCVSHEEEQDNLFVHERMSYSSV